MVGLADVDRALYVVSTRGARVALGQIRPHAHSLAGAVAPSPPATLRWASRSGRVSAVTWRPPTLVTTPSSINDRSRQVSPAGGLQPRVRLIKKTLPLYL